MRLILVGNYGVGNLGDEALKDYMLHAFPAAEWQVISARPSGVQELPRIPSGVRSFFFTPWMRTVLAIRKADGLVFGGGSLFTDVESAFACWLWYLHAAVAFFFGTPVFLSFQGIGPFRSAFGERLARRVMAKAAYVSVRDRFSFDRVRSWDKSVRTVQTSDPVFSVFHQGKVEHGTQQTFVIIPRRNSPDMFREQAITLSEHYPSMAVRIIAMQPDDASERATIARLCAAFPTAEVVPARSTVALLAALKDASLVLTQRYHGALAAIALGIPVEIAAQGSKDKLSSLQSSDGITLSADELKRAIREGECTLKEALAELPDRS